MLLVDQSFQSGHSAVKLLLEKNRKWVFDDVY